jgi:protein TonB
MLYHKRDTDYLSRRSVALLAIILLHVLAIYILASGFASSHVRYASTIIQTRLLPPDKIQQLPPPPPPQVNLVEDAPIQVIAPEIDLPIPADALQPPVQIPAAETDEAPTAPAPVMLSGPTSRPRPISGPDGRERYPKESIVAKETGTPTITICVSATGTVDSVQVTRSSGFPRLDEAAVGIGRDFRFKPAMRQGQPVPVCVSYGVKFGINNL